MAFNTHHLLRCYVLLFLACVAVPAGANSDLLRGLENYLQIVKKEKGVEELSPKEVRDVLEIHELLQAFGVSKTVGQGCDPVVESRIDGTFEGWDGETVFELANGQIWQQSSYSYTYTYSYAYMPEVLIYPSRNSCKLKVEGVDKTIRVIRLR